MRFAHSAIELATVFRRLRCRLPFLCAAPRFPSPVYMMAGALSIDLVDPFSDHTSMRRLVLRSHLMT